jgi:hypothetical protein
MDITPGRASDLMTFDLDDGSSMMMIFKDYLEEKGYG